MIMNDVKEKLIHLLGGVTKDEHEMVLRYKRSSGELLSCELLLDMMKKAYGMPADQWAKYVYEETEEYLEHCKWWYDTNETALKKWGLL